MAAFVLAGLLLALGSPAAEKVRGHVDHIFADERFQTELPGDGARPPAGSPDRAREGGSLFGGGINLAVSSISQILLWGLVAAVLVVGVLWGVREFRFTAPAPPARGDPDHVVHDDHAVVKAPLRDADVLAASGDYGAAVHALLLKTLAELVHRTSRPIPYSLTSREILARVDLRDAARDALRGLVGAVELSHFGGTPPSAADFARCRGHFETFAAAYQRGAA